MRASLTVPLAASVLALSACAAPTYRVETAPKMILPSEDSPTELGVRTVKPDEILISEPVGFLAAVRLETDTIVSVAGKKFAFASDETLPLGRVTGPSVDKIPTGSLIFCGRPNSELARSMLAATTLGLSSLFSKTTGATQVCFIDEEKDGAATSAILIGLKSDKNDAPVEIEPVAYNVIAAERMSGESEAKIVYRGKTGMVGGHISFDLHVIEQGIPLYFDNTRRKINIRDLPQTVTIFGAKFEVRSYDRERGEIEVDVQKGFPLTNYGVHRTYTTRSIPIYIPG